jgi:hypothetical protein
MTRDDIIRMAQEAGITYQLVVSGWGQHWIDIPVHFERFAALVAAAAVRETSAEYRLGWNDGAMMEREACAKLADAELRNLVVLTSWPGQSSAAFNIAKAIRARGQE